MDGGMNTQTFEGIDYSSSMTRAEQLGLFDIGKRDRKPIANYSENAMYEATKNEANLALKKPSEPR